MEKQKVLVLEKPLICNECNQEFSGYTEAPEEGFGYEAQLYECKFCHTIFSHSIESAMYRGPLNDQIVDRLCPTCNSSLKDSLEKRNLVGVCPKCGKANYKALDEAREEYIETYQLYN